jgi:hypothetical protein
MPAKHYHLLGTKSSRGDHGTKTDGAIAHHCRDFPRTNLRANGGMMSCAHDVGKCEQARHQLVIGPDRQFYNCPIGLRHSRSFTLSAIEPGAAPESAVQTGRL